VAFNAGAIEARLTVDRTSFSNGLKAAKAEAEKFARQKFEVKITPKIERTELQRIKAEIERVTGNIKVKVSLDNASLQAVKQRIDRTVGNIKVKLDADTAALQARLNALKAKININLNITAAEKARIKAEIERISPTIVVRLRYDRDTLEELIRRLREAGDAGRRSGDDGSEAFGRMGGQMRAILAVAPLLGPALAVGINGAVGAAGALLSILGMLGPAFGALALVAVPVWEQIKTESLKTNEEIAKLPNGLRQASQAMKDLRRDLDYIRERTTPEVGNMFAAGFRAAQAAIYPIIPLIQQTALGVTDVANKFKALFQSSQYQEFIDWLSTKIRPLLNQIGDILVNTTRSVMGLTEAFQPLASWILDKISIGMKAFADWTSKLDSDPAFQKWLEDVKVDLELLWKFLVQVVTFIKNLVVELEPLGRPIMQGLIAALKFLNSLPPGMLGAIAMGITSIMTALILGAGGPVSLGIGAITAAATALMYLYQHSESARQTMDQFVTWLKTTWAPIWEIIRTNFEDKIKPAFEKMWDVIKNKLWPALQEFGIAIETYVVPKLGPLFDVITGKVIPALIDFLTKCIELVAYLIQTFGPTIADIFGRVVGIVTGALEGASGVIEAFIGLVTGDWEKFGQGIHDITEGFWTAVAGVFGLTLDELKAKMQQWDQDITTTWNNTWDGLKGYLDQKGQDIQTGWSQFLDTFRGNTQTTTEDTRSVFQRAMDAIGQTVQSAGQTIQQRWNELGTWMSGVGSSFLQRVQDLFGSFGTQVGQRVQEAAAAIGRAWDAVAEFFAKPIRWVIDVVINQGIVGSWNKVMGMIGQPASLSAVSGIGSYAEGGLIQGPGTGTSDSILARVSAGEYIVPAATARANLGLLQSLPRFQTGGTVPPPLATGTAGATVNPGTTATAPKQSWWDRIGTQVTSMFQAIKNYASMPAIGMLTSSIQGAASRLVDNVLATLRDKLINIFPPAAPGAENLSPYGQDPRFAQTLDRGGILRSLIPMNTSGHAERVLSPRQTQDFSQLVGILNDMFHPTKTKSPTGGDIYHITLPKGASVRELANEIAFRKRVASKGRYSPR